MRATQEPSLLEISRKVLTSPREGFELAIAQDHHGAAHAICLASSVLCLTLQYLSPGVLAQAPDTTSIILTAGTPVFLYAWGWCIGIIGRLCGGVRNDRAVRIVSGFAALPVVPGLLVALPFTFVDGTEAGVLVALLILICWSCWITVIGTAVAMKFSFFRATLAMTILTVIATVIFFVMMIAYVLATIDASEGGSDDRQPTREIDGPLQSV
ncbi:MAG: YIP1 family protein [Deltaproteobacteria bacterium]|nr:YIP1 family protein [Deltaproteobacteria bacterium]